MIPSRFAPRCRRAAVGAPGKLGAAALPGALALRGATAPAARPAQGPKAPEAAAVASRILDGENLPLFVLVDIVWYNE